MATEIKPLDQLLKGHEPFPAVVVDNDWNMVASNTTIGILIEGVKPELLETPANVLRICLHPDGMAPRILNFAQYRTHLLRRLWRQATYTGSESLLELYRELDGYPAGEQTSTAEYGVFAPCHIRYRDQELSFFSTYTTFDTAHDVTAAELAIESFYPADELTRRVLEQG